MERVTAGSAASSGRSGSRAASARSGFADALQVDESELSITVKEAPIVQPNVVVAVAEFITSIPIAGATGK